MRPEPRHDPNCDRIRRAYLDSGLGAGSLLPGLILNHDIAAILLDGCVADSFDER